MEVDEKGNITHHGPTEASTRDVSESINAGVFRAYSQMGAPVWDMDNLKDTDYVVMPNGQRFSAGEWNRTVRHEVEHNVENAKSVDDFLPMLRTPEPPIGPLFDHDGRLDLQAEGGFAILGMIPDSYQNDVILGIADRLCNGDWNEDGSLDGFDSDQVESIADSAGVDPATMDRALSSVFSAFSAQIAHYAIERGFEPEAFADFCATRPGDYKRALVNLAHARTMESFEPIAAAFRNLTPKETY